MLRHQAYKFELRPPGAKVRLLRQFDGSCWYVYNKALALQKERYKLGEKQLKRAELNKLLRNLWRTSTYSVDNEGYKLTKRLKAIN